MSKYFFVGRWICLLAFVAGALVFVDPVFAQQANAPQAPGFGEVLSRMTPMFLLVFMIYYFMIVKPQQLKLKSQSDLVSSLKKGDSVVTGGGIFGRVVAVETDSVSIEVAPNVKIKVELAQISRKIEAAKG